MQLDDAYANAAYIEGSEAFPARWSAAAQAYREALVATAEINVKYGAGDRQVYDLFHPDGPSCGLFLFVHGGYWRAFDKSSWSHLAEGMRSRGWTVAMPSYDLCPVVGIPDITRQIAKATTRAAQRIAGPICLAGHSAGGHLVARMACEGVLPKDIAARLQTVLPISPLSDLRPLMLTSMNADFGLDEETAKAESPIFGKPVSGAKVIVWVGGYERPVFIEQAQWLSEAWHTDLHIQEGRHHFDLIDSLANRESEMVGLLEKPT